MLLNRRIRVATSHLRRTVHIPPGLAGPGNPQRVDGIRLARNSVGRLLAQLGITPQKPLYRASERDDTLVGRWLKTEYPKIRKMAKAQGADIYFGDAAHIRSDHHAGRTWGKKGE